MAFEDHVERENWYHLLVEMLSGYSLSQSRLRRMAQGLYLSVSPSLGSPALSYSTTVCVHVCDPAGLKDPGVMEMAQGHVLLQNTINQSGILENCQHVRRTKRAMVRLGFRSTMADRRQF